MKIVELPIKYLKEASWNANRMDSQMLARLKESISRYGLVSNLVVRQISKNIYEVLSGNQRLRLLSEMGFTSVPCFVVKMDDDQARLLSQALNRIQGEDDLGLRADLLCKVLKSIPEQEIAAILPETTENLRALANLGQITNADYLRNFENARQARLKHLQFQLTGVQLEVIEKALGEVLSKAKTKGENPNIRGNALYLLCKFYLEKNRNE